MLTTKGVLALIKISFCRWRAFFHLVQKGTGRVLVDPSEQYIGCFVLYIKWISSVAAVTPVMCDVMGSILRNGESHMTSMWADVDVIWSDLIRRLEIIRAYHKLFRLIIRALWGKGPIWKMGACPGASDIDAVWEAGWYVVLRNPIKGQI